MLELARWPAAEVPTLLVGHQPGLGALVGRLLGLPAGSLSVRKGGLWWLRYRIREGQGRVVVHAVISPDID